jgi:hypothetical protein
MDTKAQPQIELLRNAPPNLHVLVRLCGRVYAFHRDRDGLRYRELPQPRPTDAQEQPMAVDL